MFLKVGIVGGADTYGRLSVEHAGDLLTSLRIITDTGFLDPIA